MLTDEMKKEIIEYVLPEGSFCKGLIENDGPTAIAYDEGTIDAHDIYKFLNEVRESVLATL